MTSLRDTILKKLAGTNSQNPVPLENLRAIAEPICDDLVDLYNLLDQLYLDKTIQRASGYKNSQPFVSYWLSGAIQTPGPFRISTPAPTPRAVLVRKVATPEQAAAKMHPATTKVQPNTAKELPAAFVSQKQESQPITQESTMTKATVGTKDIVALVTSKPGIKRDDAMKHLVSPDGSNKSKVTALITYAIKIKSLNQTEKDGDLLLYAANKPVSAPQSTSCSSQGQAAEAPKAGSRIRACNRQSPRRLRSGIQLRLRRPQGWWGSHLQGRHLGCACAL